MAKLLKNPPVKNLLPQKQANQAALQVWVRGRWVPEHVRENSPLEERKCLLGAVKPLVPCTFTAATRNWYHLLARMSGSRTRSSVVWWGKCHTYIGCSGYLSSAVPHQSVWLRTHWHHRLYATTPPDSSHHSALQSIYSCEQNPILQCIASLFWEM